MTTTTDLAPRYLSAAFYSQYNLILLAGSAMFSLAAASPLPLAVGVAAEVCWLGLGQRLPMFRRRIDQRVEGERRSRSDDEIMLAMRALNPEHTARLLAIGHDISWISLQTEAMVTSPSERAALLELENLRPAFMRLCYLHERVRLRVEELRMSPPEDEAARLSQAYAAEKDLGLRFTLHQAIKGAQRKIEQRARLLEVLGQVELKLSLVERSLSHLRQQQQLAGVGSDWPHDVQAIMMHVLLLPALEAELANEP